MADPNHPPNLAIAPSSLRQRDGPDSIPASWQVDTAQDIDRWGIAGRIWEAAYLFRTYLRPQRLDTVEFDPPCPLFVHSESLSRPTERILPLHIVELGSGVGLVGLACADELRGAYGGADNSKGERRASEITRRTGDDGDAAASAALTCNLVLTDLENVVPLIQRNAISAGFAHAERSTSSQSGPAINVLVRPLPWGSSSHAEAILAELQNPCESDTRAFPLDYILCSDLVYFPELLAPLLRSLIDLTSPRAGLRFDLPLLSDEREPCLMRRSPPPVLIAYKIRSLAKEEPFWTALGSWFDVSIVNCRYPATSSEVEVASPEECKSSAWGPWHRFGAWQRDLSSSSENSDDIEAASEDAYFVFIAQRKVDTLQCSPPPQDDAALLAGVMLAEVEDDTSESESEQRQGGSQRQEEHTQCSLQRSRRKLVRRTDGAEFLEWALMGEITSSE